MHTNSLLIMSSGIEGIIIMLACRLGTGNSCWLRGIQLVSNSGCVRSRPKSRFRETHPERGSVDCRVVLVDLGLHLARHYFAGFVSQCGGAVGGNLHRFAVSHSYASCLLPRRRLESFVSEHEWLVEALER